MKKILLLYCLFLASYFYASSQVTLNLNLYIEGYYQGSGFMRHVMFNQAVTSSNSNQVDTLFIDLHDGVVPSLIVASSNGILLIDGTFTCSFPALSPGVSYYIAVRHRSTIETWSAAPVLMTSVTNYDFASSNCSAYGCNQSQVDVGPSRWAFYSGDVNQDGNIDLFDFVTIYNDINNGLFGYHVSDLNGDGNTDLLDFPVLDANINIGIYSRRP